MVASYRFDGVVVTHPPCCTIGCSEEGLGSGARRGLAELDPSPYNRGLLERTLGVAVIELAQIGGVRECCGERYMLVEQQSGSLVWRGYARADDRERRPLAVCRRCATAILPYPGGAAEPGVGRD